VRSFAFELVSGQSQRSDASERFQCVYHEMMEAERTFRPLGFLVPKTAIAVALKGVRRADADNTIG